MPDEIFFRDLPLDPSVNSEGDLSSVTNRESIKQSLRMMLNTGKGTRIFMPDYGCRIRGFLFEPFDSTTARRMGEEVQEAIKNHEPRIEILNINVDMIVKDNSYEMSVSYRIVNTQVVDALKVTLERL
jgi:phage baseplate assembly protein W